MTQLTLQQAYCAMFYLWEEVYSRTKSDEIGTTLGEFSWDAWADNMPGDPAAWDRWKTAVEKALSDGLDAPRNEDRHG
ncbi:MAG TPA: hypothetical protein VN229_07175 [Terriglobales bacterium]|nr:hypothetical protein [Terriglobales bacterium]